jgi:hypothetical protein
LRLRQGRAKRLRALFLEHGSDRLQSLLFFLAAGQLPETEPQQQQLDKNGSKSEHDA